MSGIQHAGRLAKLALWLRECCLDPTIDKALEVVKGVESVPGKPSAVSFLANADGTLLIRDG
jgi:hypothetical protein